MTRLLKAVMGVSFALAALAPSLATAQVGKRHVARVAGVAQPLTVNRRSWLDSGNVVPVGTGQSYISSNTTLHTPVYASFAPDRFGQSTLPGQFDLPLPGNPRGPETGGIFFDE